MSPSAFATFYHAVHGYAPFPWQARLVQRLLANDWPRTLALPTSSGKTSILDGLVFALATQADRPARERTVPLRTCFVIDRRLVVDRLPPMPSTWPTRSRRRRTAWWPQWRTGCGDS